MTIPDTRWIAATSEVLRRVLAHGVALRDPVLEQVHVSALPPDQIELTVTRPTLNVMLYDVREDAQMRNAEGAANEAARTIRVLLTAYGPVHDDAGDIAHRLLGAAIEVLDAHPVLDPEQLQALPPLHAGLPMAQRLRIAPVPMTLEDMSRLWGMLRASYRLSRVYDVALMPVHTSEPHAPPHDAHARRPTDATLTDRPDSMLREMSAHARRGGNTLALFVATDAAEARKAAQALAKSLERELLMVDLAVVENRYIGETEKNLEALFARAAESEAVLFFDEADALFGKRSEVRDSHDRFANLEVSHLLKAMEDYPGVVVLQSNRRAALDPAFMRRLRFVVDFE